MSTVQLDIGYLNTLFAQCSDMVFYTRKVGDDYVYEYINEAASVTIPNIAVGKTVSEVMDEKLRNTIFKYYDEAIATNEQKQFQDYTMFTNDVRKFESSIYPHTIDGERYILSITRLIAFDRNIEDKYLFMRSVFFKTFLSTVLISNKYELLEANPSFLRDFDIDIEEVRGKCLMDIGLVEPQFKNLYMSYIQEAMQGQAVSSKHLQLKDTSGETRHFIGSFSALQDEQDETIAIFLILQDTTEVVKQEQKLKAISHTMDVLKSALSSSADITITDKTGHIIEVNDKYLKRCGYSREEVIGQTHRVLNSGFHPKEFFQQLWVTITSGEIWRGEVCNRSKDGQLYWNEASVIPIRNVEGEIQQYLGIYFNVSDKKKLMTELQMVERTFRLITENTNDLIVIVNELGFITYASPSYERLFGLTEQQLTNINYEQLLAETSKPQWYAALANGRHAKDMTELELLLPNGETVWTECHYKASVKETDDSKSEMTMVSRVITERKKQEDQLKFMAYHDNLTHLPNRRYLQREFPSLAESADASDTSIAIVYIDGDNFKQVNDLYGHDVGDEFIRNFGRVLANNVCDSDIVVRMGGDEFVVVCTNLSRQKDKFTTQIETFFSRVQHSLAKGWETNGIRFNPTATMGVVMYPYDATDLQCLIDLADKMLYEAKSIRRNSFKIYCAQLNM